MAGTEIRISRIAYGAAAPYCTAEECDQNSVARVRVPVGARIRVAVSSVLAARKHSAIAAPRPGETSGRVTRRWVANPLWPSDRETYSSTGGDCSSDARTLTTARGRKSIAYAATSTGTVWYHSGTSRIEK